MGFDKGFLVLPYKLYYSYTYSSSKLKILQTGFYVSCSDVANVEFHIRKF